jgi:hypothetical protein
MPDFWQCKKHDKGLLKAVSANGFLYVSQIIGHKEYGFEEVREEEITDGQIHQEDHQFPDLLSQVLFKRIEEVCTIYKEFQ